MGGKHSFFNDPTGAKAAQAGRENDARNARAEYLGKVKAFKTELEASRKSQSLSEATYNEILAGLKTSGVDVDIPEGGNYDISKMSNYAAKLKKMSAFKDEAQAEIEGTSSKGKSRLTTQKLFETMVDQPGMRQTLLTPRSNASKGIVGV